MECLTTPSLVGRRLLPVRGRAPERAAGGVKALRGDALERRGRPERAPSHPSRSTWHPSRGYFFRRRHRGSAKRGTPHPLGVAGRARGAPRDQCHWKCASASAYAAETKKSGLLRSSDGSERRSVEDVFSSDAGATSRQRGVHTRASGEPRARCTRATPTEARTSAPRATLRRRRERPDAAQAHVREGVRRSSFGIRRSGFRDPPKQLRGPKPRRRGVGSSFFTPPPPRLGLGLGLCLVLPPPRASRHHLLRRPGDPRTRYTASRLSRSTHERRSSGRVHAAHRSGSALGVDSGVGVAGLIIVSRRAPGEPPEGERGGSARARPPPPPRDGSTSRRC